MEKEIPQLEEIAGKTWKKEEELKGLKAELAALDRKIQFELVSHIPKIDKHDKSHKMYNKTENEHMEATILLPKIRIVF